MGRMIPSIVAARADDDPLKVWYIFRVQEHVRGRAGCGREWPVKPEDRRTGGGLIDALKTLQSGVQQTTTPAAAAAYSLSGAIMFLGGLGYLFDRWQGTKPTGLIVGLLLGVVVGLYLLAKELWRR